MKTNELTDIERQEYLNKLQECLNLSTAKSLIERDQEKAHINADDILCEILIKLGYSDLVDVYNRIEKYYI